MIPLLFNRWRDPVCDFGGLCLEHIVPGLSFMSDHRDDLFACAEGDWPLSDILSIHPYYVWNAPHADEAKYEAFLDEVVELAQSKGKELLAIETLWVAVDDD